MAAPKLSVSTPIIATLAAILFLVAAVDASTYRTTITTTTVGDERHKPCKSGESCEEQIKGHEFTNCEQFILNDGQGDWQTCCGELWQLDEGQCRCDVLKEIVKKGEGMDGADVENIKARAYSTVAYCRMGTPQGCGMERSLVLKDV